MSPKNALGITMKVLCVMFVLLASGASAQTNICAGPPPTTVSLNPTHVFADLYDLAQHDAFDVAYFDGTALVQGPFSVLKTAWTKVTGDCYKATLPAPPSARGSFTARVRWRTGTTLGAWSEASSLFGRVQVTNTSPIPSDMTIGPAELLYTDAQMPLTMDGTFATLAQDATTMQFFGKNYPYDVKWTGTLAKPFQTTVWSKLQGAVWNMRGHTGNAWLVNIYQIDTSGRLLGFLHRETPNSATYSVGLGYSTNGGDTWTYLGDIVAPQNNAGNVGGVPYLVVGDYFHVYFNEYPSAANMPPGQYQRRMSVARALVTDVLQAAANSTVTPWKKFNSGAWTQDGLTGLASNIIPDWNPVYTDYQQTDDLHSDAAYNTALQRYMLLVQTHNRGELLLYLSDDGVDWNTRAVVDTAPPNFMQPYSTIVGLAGASADSHEVGSEFYILYPRKDYPRDYASDDLYRRKVTVGPPPPPPPPDGSDVYISDMPWIAVTNGWGPAERDQSNGDLPAGDGRELTLKGIPYAKGVGVHANSSIRIALGGQYTTFVSDIGVDDEAAAAGSVIFTVVADGATIYDSGVLTRASPTQTITVSVAGKTELELRVGTTPDGDGSDHADWAGAYLIGTETSDSCTYVLSPATAQAFSAAGGTRNISVTTQDGCPWTVSSTVAWLTTSTPSGTGTDDAIYVVAPNPSMVPRTGTLTIQGQAVTVTQEGVTCATTGPTVVIENIAPRTLTLGKEGLVTVRVRSASNRQIARITFGFDAPSTYTVELGIGNVGAVNRFTFKPSAVGKFIAFVEAEDETGCVTRAKFGPRITVTAVVP